jgi:uncharacterized protein with PIN domain
MRISLAPGLLICVMKFIADAMLGRLARWMRFLGFDTLYYTGISDAKLIRLAMEQDRIILTRDTRLVRAKSARNHLLISANDSFEQLLEVAAAFKLKEYNFLSRCVKCNGKLLNVVDKAAIKESVPEYVFLQHNDFLKCADCGKIYWEGSHPKQFKQKVSEFLGPVS